MSNKIFNRAQIDDMPQRYRANFVNSLSGPKSANVVGTIDDNGNTNLCLVTSVFHVGANPPLMGMLMRPHTVPRDTLENIKASGEYTINHVNSAYFKQAHQTSARYPREQSEFDATGLTALFSEAHSAPYVAQARVKIGLKTRQITKLDLNETELVIGEIVEVSVLEESLLDDGCIDLNVTDSVAASGLDTYHRLECLDKLSYAKPDEELRSLKGEKS